MDKTSKTQAQQGNAEYITNKESLTAWINAVIEDINGISWQCETEEARRRAVQLKVLAVDFKDNIPFIAGKD